MTPAELIGQNDLVGALASATNAVRANPADPKQRLLLAQLNCVLSRWEKALDQFALYASLSSDADSRIRARLAQVAVQCEVFREEVFAGRRTPLLFGEPEPWLGWLVESVHLLSKNKNDAAAALRDKAFEEAPTAKGKIDGRPFEWLADADTRLGPVLELFMEGKYYWVPFNRIRRVAIDPPVDLCDLVFLPAQFKWVNGGEGAGYIPVRYSAPQRETNSDPRFALSRMTDWTELPGTFVVGTGQRMLATDAEEVSLLETRIIDFEE
ncbi:MAG: hypothetical protein LBS59_09125 [Puniceicoccales bacterium]|jgi:type VI secretion system protein ImpE|nr:hypothetical protein [Puniceicoccales bacterium]